MTRITIEGITYEVPATWNEITTEQLVALIRICASEKMTAPEVQLKFLLHCVYGCVIHYVDKETYIINTRNARHTLTAEELASVLSVFDYLFDTNDTSTSLSDRGERYLSPKFTTNHFKTVRIGCTNMYGADDALWDITYDQFIDLQTWQSQFNDNPDAVNEFISVLYKTRSGKRDIAKVRKFSDVVKTATLWYYLGSMHFLMEKFPRVFSGTGEANGSVYDNQQRIIDSLAEGDVTKKMQVRESLLPDALYSMECAAQRIEEMEKKFSKQ